jgi:hypothetical protein
MKTLSAKITGNCNRCGKPGHMARYCQSKQDKDGKDIKDNKAGSEKEASGANIEMILSNIESNVPFQAGEEDEREAVELISTPNITVEDPDGIVGGAEAAMAMADAESSYGSSWSYSCSSERWGVAQGMLCGKSVWSEHTYDPFLDAVKSAKQRRVSWCNHCQMHRELVRKENFVTSWCPCCFDASTHLVTDEWTCELDHFFAFDKAADAAEARGEVEVVHDHNPIQIMEAIHELMQLQLDIPQFYTEEAGNTPRHFIVDPGHTCQELGRQCVLHTALLEIYGAKEESEESDDTSDTSELFGSESSSSVMSEDDSRLFGGDSSSSDDDSRLVGSDSSSDEDTSDDDSMPDLISRADSRSESSEEVYDVEVDERQLETEREYRATADVAYNGIVLQLNESRPWGSGIAC